MRLQRIQEQWLLVERTEKREGKLQGWNKWSDETEKNREDSE